MSNIPSSAMPHAAPKNNNNEGGNSSGSQDRGGDNKKGVSARAGKIADKARENPKTAIAAGAAVLAGAVAAIAIPKVRARRNDGDQAKAGGTAKSGSAKKSGSNNGSSSSNKG